MPNGLWYARGTYKTRTAVAASAFSKGDLLMYDSSSSLSRWDVRFPSGAKIAGVALADSLDSFTDNKVPYIVPDADTVFWSRVTPTSAFTPGLEVDLVPDAAGRPVADTSSNSARFVFEEIGNSLPDQSTQSYGMGRILSSTTANLEHS